MIPFLTPTYLKQGKAVLKNAQKLLNYKRDILPSGVLASVEEEIAALTNAIRARDRATIEKSATALDRHFVPYQPTKYAAWRENTEVFLVAIVVALGVRTYFLQPFTIPTGSMQPTLNGIIGVPTEQEPPNILVRLLHQALLGRTYINAVAEQNEEIQSLTEHQYLRFFTFTQIATNNRNYWVHCGRDTLANYFHVRPGETYKAGNPIARGYVNTGDHVFVDKISYHFRTPSRSDVFVFKTTNITGIESRLDPRLGSQFYIKRLAGLPGDELRIDPPKLFVDGEPAKEPGFQKVEAAQNGYRGYAQGPSFGYLNDPQSSFSVPAHSYFALGDNSYNSSDSRYWGVVPQENIMGRGFLVYWPFTSHWGLIK